MNIIIPMKRVPDTETRIGVSGGQVDPSSLKSWIINPYDEYAIEDALQLVEKQGGGKITVVTIGPEGSQETIRKALAMGADEGVLVKSDDSLDAMGRARLLAAAVEKLGDFDLIWAGSKGIDEDSGLTGIYLAEMLDLPHVSDVARVKDFSDGDLTVQREVEGGHETVRVSTPALITQQKGDTEPRYPSLKGIMGAKKKPLTEWSADDLGVDSGDLESKIEVVSVQLPPARSAGRKIDGDSATAARELVRLLREEAKVI